MAVDPRLLSFVEDATRQGAPPEEIAAALKDGGWEAREIDAALGSFAGVRFSVPVPRKPVGLQAREFVFHLFLFATLYVAAFSVINLSFAILDIFLPKDDGPEMRWLIRDVRNWTAWCVVFVPVFLLTAWRADRNILADPSIPLSPGRQWLTYLTLFLAGLTGLGDLVAAVRGLLSGDATLRFYLKVLVVGGVAGAVFVYYSNHVREGRGKSKPDSS